MRRLAAICLTAIAVGACTTSAPIQPLDVSDEFPLGEVESHSPGVQGEVRTVTLPDPDGEPFTFSYEVIDGLAIFESDMILGTAEEFAEFEDADEIIVTPEGAALYRRVCWRFVVNLRCKHYRWPDGIVPYTFRDNWGSAANNTAMRQRIRDAMDEIEAVTAVRFVPRDGHADFVRFERGDGCSAHVGRQSGRQGVFLSFGGCGTWTIVHELLHALGIKHEHTRHDRDDFVDVITANIESGRGHNFETSKKAFDIGAYDHDSVMHYPKWAFARDVTACNNGILNACTVVPTGDVDPDDIGQRQRLSVGDISAVNALYPGPAPTLTFHEPSDGSTHQLNLAVTFRATATAPDFVPGCCTFTWHIDGVSSTDHREGGGTSVRSHAFPTLGTRVVTVTARTGTGATASASTTVHVVNTPPSVSIVSPGQGTELHRGLPVTLRGSSFDPNEPGGALGCDRLSWTSSVAGDPFPVSGCEVDVVFASNGARTLTLTGTDPQGATGSASVGITVVDPPPQPPPVVQILSPTANTVVNVHAPLTLSGTASSPGGHVPLAIEWTVFGTRNGNPFGPHVIATTLEAVWTPSETLGSSESSYVMTLQLRATDTVGGSGTDALTFVFSVIN